MYFSVGIDFGNRRTVVATHPFEEPDINSNNIELKGINSVIRFGDTRRHFGSGEEGETITNIKRMLGVKYDSVDLQALRMNTNMKIIRGASGFAAISTKFKKVDVTMRAEQLVGPFLNHLFQDIMEYENVVIAIPPYWTDKQRNALISSAHIGGIKKPRLINSSLASAIGVWMEIKETILPNQQRNIVSIDYGHTGVTVSLIQLTDSSVSVPIAVCDHTIGGSVIEDALCLFMIQKAGLDPYLNPGLRPIVHPYAVETLAQISKKSVHSITITLPEEGPTTFRITRFDVDRVISRFIPRYLFLLKRCMNAAQRSSIDVDSVFLGGGITQSPFVQQKTSDFFITEPLVTLHDNSSISIGCCVYSSILSARSNLNLELSETSPRSINISWDNARGEKRDEMIFSEFAPIPCSKVVKIDFHGKTPVSVRDDKGEVALMTLDGPSKDGIEANVTFSYDQDGVLDIICDCKGTALVFDEHLTESSPIGPTAPVEAPVTIDIDFRRSVLPGTLSDMAALESNMKEEDVSNFEKDQIQFLFREKLEEMENEVKNGLIPYIHSDKLEEFMGSLKDARQWDVDSIKNSPEYHEYKAKYDYIKSVGDSAKRRKELYQNFVVHVSELKSRIRSITDSFRPGSHDYGILSRIDKQSIRRAAKDLVTWLDDSVTKMIHSPRYDEPPLTEEDGNQRVSDLERMYSAAIAKVHRKVPLKAQTLRAAHSFVSTVMSSRSSAQAETIQIHPIPLQTRGGRIDTTPTNKKPKRSDSTMILQKLQSEYPKDESVPSESIAE